MLVNEGTRLKIWLQLKDRFNYSEFYSICNQNSVEVLSKLEFAQKAGMLSCAQIEYPDLGIQDAYLKFISTPPPQAIITTPIASTQENTNSKPQPTISRCGGCGGGGVR